MLLPDFVPKRQSHASSGQRPGNKACKTYVKKRVALILIFIVFLILFLILINLNLPLNRPSCGFPPRLWRDRRSQDVSLGRFSVDRREMKTFGLAFRSSGELSRVAGSETSPRQAEPWRVASHGCAIEWQIVPLLGCNALGRLARERAEKDALATRTVSQRLAGRWSSAAVPCRSNCEVSELWLDAA